MVRTLRFLTCRGAASSPPLPAGVTSLMPGGGARNQTAWAVPELPIFLVVLTKGKREVIYHHLHAFASLPAYTGKFQAPTMKWER